MTITKNIFKVATSLVLTSLFLSFVSPALAEDQHFEETTADGQATMVTDVHTNEGVNLNADATLVETDNTTPEQESLPEQASGGQEEIPTTETTANDEETLDADPEVTSGSFTDVVNETITLSSCPTPTTEDADGSAADETEAQTEPSQGNAETASDEIVTAQNTEETMLVEQEEQENDQETSETVSNETLSEPAEANPVTASEEPALEEQQAESTAATTESTSTTINQEDCDSPVAIFEAAKEQKSDAETLTIINVDDVEVETTLVTDASTGRNLIESKTDSIKDADLTSGKINVFANVLTVVNTNSINSELTTIAENYEALARDISLRFPEGSLGEKAQFLVAGVCDTDSVDCQSFSSFVLSNTNDADVHVDATLTGDSGHNSIKAGDDITRARLTTGDVNAVVNVLNIINTNLINSRWTIVSYNIFGNYDKDIILPSQLELLQFLSVGGSGPDLSGVEQVFININNENKATIENNVALNAVTGHDSMQSISDDINDSSIESGDAATLATVNNVYNNNILNAKWYLGIVNFLQGWSGKTYSQPDHVLMSRDDMGFTLMSMSGVATEQLEGLAAENSPDETNIEGNEDVTVIDNSTTTSTGAADVLLLDVDNDNEAKLVNDISVTANTGYNDITAGDNIKDSHLKTGTAKALANIINFVNTNLINADVYVGVVNIFGKWTGNLLFGYPDLSVSQSLPSPGLPAGGFSTGQLQIAYGNNSGSRADDISITWGYDTTRLRFLGSPNALTAAEITPGTVVFTVPSLNPNGTASIALNVISQDTIPVGAELTTFAKISTAGPEVQLSNNEHVFTFVATAGSLPGAGGIGGSSNTSGSSQNGTVVNSPQGQVGAQDETASTVPATNNPPATENTNTNPPTGQNNTGSQENVNTQGSSQEQLQSDGGNNQNQNQNGPVQPQATTPPPPQGGTQPTFFPLRVVKTNSATGPVGPGSSVDFTITVQNVSTKKISLVTLNDTLHGPGSQVYGQQILEIGEMKAGESVEIAYTLPLPPDAPFGTYVNAAFAKGVTSALQSTESLTATSQFTLSGGAEVVHSKKALEEAKLEEEKAKIEEEKKAVIEETVEEISEDETQDGQVLGSITLSNLPPGTSYSAESATITRKVGNSVKKTKVGTKSKKNPFWDVLGTQAEDSNAAILAQLSTSAQGQSPANRQLMSTIFICVLIAFGYALSNARSRGAFKKFAFAQWASKFTIF